MGKNSDIYGAPRYPTPRLCIGCHKRPVFYGDRCTSCAKELRQRRKRKPR